MDPVPGRDVETLGRPDRASEDSNVGIVQGLVDDRTRHGPRGQVRGHLAEAATVGVTPRQSRGAVRGDEPANPQDAGNPVEGRWALADEGEVPLDGCRAVRVFGDVFGRAANGAQGIEDVPAPSSSGSSTSGVVSAPWRSPVVAARWARYSFMTPLRNPSRSSQALISGSPLPLSRSTRVDASPAVDPFGEFEDRPVWIGVAAAQSNRRVQSQVFQASQEQE